MQIDFTKPSGRRLVWFGLALCAAVWFAYSFFGHTVPKMSATGDGATLPDFGGPVVSFVLAIVAVIRAMIARDPIELVNAFKALAANPTSQDLIGRAETALLSRLRAIHQDHPAVLDKIHEVAVEIAKVNCPRPDPSPPKPPVS